jgi:hypothetical protein
MKFGNSILALVLLAMTGGATAQTQVYRCTAPSGAVEYTQFPCERAGDSQKVVRTDDALAGTDPSASIRQLDTLIADLISRREYDRARDLAVTREQYATITAAQNADPIALWQAQSEASRAEADAARAEADAARSSSGNDDEPQYASRIARSVWYPSGYGYWDNDRRWHQPRQPHATLPGHPSKPGKRPPTAARPPIKAVLPPGKTPVARQLPASVTPPRTAFRPSRNTGNSRADANERRPHGASM